MFKPSGSNSNLLYKIIFDHTSTFNHKPYPVALPAIP